MHTLYRRVYLYSLDITVARNRYTGSTGALYRKGYSSSPIVSRIVDFFADAASEAIVDVLAVIYLGGNDMFPAEPLSAVATLKRRINQADETFTHLLRPSR